MAIHFNDWGGPANSYWQIGHTLLRASISIAQDGHSLVFIFQRSQIQRNLIAVCTTWWKSCGVLFIQIL